MFNIVSFATSRALPFLFGSVVALAASQSMASARFGSLSVLPTGE